MQLNITSHPPTISLRDKDVEREIPTSTHDIRQLFFLMTVESPSGLIGTSIYIFQRKRRTRKKCFQLDAFKLFPFDLFPANFIGNNGNNRNFHLVDGIR